MANSKPGFNLKALGYALLWQSYWLPVLLIVAHDQWLQVRQLQPPDHPQQQPALPAPSQAKGHPPLASVLAVQSHSVDALPETPAQVTAAQATTSLVTPAQVTALPRGNNPLSNATLEATSQPLRGRALVGQRTTKSL